jgi:hypothetical protein
MSRDTKMFLATLSGGLVAGLLAIGILFASGIRITPQPEPPPSVAIAPVDAQPPATPQPVEQPIEPVSQVQVNPGPTHWDLERQAQEAKAAMELQQRTEAAIAIRAGMAARDAQDALVADRVFREQRQFIRENSHPVVQSVGTATRKQ